VGIGAVALTTVLGRSGNEEEMMQSKVAVLGGGVAGMTAAHELIERGFAVEVYELKAIPGGKARSIPVPGTGTAGRADLPGEHGFRFFPRFYKHVPDTMKRIPYGSRTVFENLVDTTDMEMTRYGQPPVVQITRFPRSLQDVKVFLKAIYTNVGVSDADLEFFGDRLWQILTSCQERRMDEYEKLGWWDYVQADRRSAAYQTVLAHGITRSLVAAKANLASTRTIGDIFVQLLLDIAEPGGSTDRLLCGPTNDVWIQPWLDYLTKRGVIYHFNAQVVAINCQDGLIKSATVAIDGANRDVTADYYVAAMPIEVMSGLITPEMIQADPTLANIQTLHANVEWMNGIQFYLTTPVPIVHGHCNHIDTQWALTSISQAQFWPSFDLSRYGDGTVKDILSVDISDWDTPGLSGKTARNSTREEIQREVWEQIKKSVNVGAAPTLQDEYLHSWFLDPDIVFFEDPQDGDPARKDDREPLLVNLIDTWQLRPDAYTRISNLFLASDYVRTYTDLATMEAANEAARRAVNAIIDASGARAKFCDLWNLHEPDVVGLWRAHDRERYLRGLPWSSKLIEF
jgi:15-cis-phytoene desaturase